MCFQPRFNFHSKIGERLLEVVPLSQLLLVCFALFARRSLARSLSLWVARSLAHFAHLRLRWRCCALALSLSVLIAALQTLNLHATTSLHSGANCINMQFRERDLRLRLRLHARKVNFYYRMRRDCKTFAQKGSRQHMLPASWGMQQVDAENMRQQLSLARANRARSRQSGSRAYYIHIHIHIHIHMSPRTTFV